MCVSDNKKAPRVAARRFSTNIVLPKRYKILCLYNWGSYLTIAFTAFAPSIATTTTPAGAAIVALSEDTTVLATV